MADKQIRAEIDIDPKPAVEGLEQVADSADETKKAVDELKGVSVDVDTGQAEGDLEALAEIADELAQEPPTIEPTADTGQAEGDLKDLGDTASALAQDAPKIEPTADTAAAEADLKSVKDTADDLAKNPPKIDVQVDAGSIDNARAKLGETRQGIDDVGKSADSSKSVLANMVGNSAQDIGALGGIAGSAGVALGQFGEYAADAASAGDSFGQIVKSFGSVAAPIAGLALLTIALQKYNEEQEKAKKKTEELKKAQEDLREGNQQTFIEETAKQYEGLILQLDQAGISQKEFLELVRDGKPIEDFRERMAEAGFSTEGFGNDADAAALVLNELRGEFLANEQAIDRNRTAQDLLAEGFGKVRGAGGEFIDLSAGIPAILDAVSQSMDAETQAAAANQEQSEANVATVAAHNEALLAEADLLKESASAFNDRVTAQRAAADAQFGLRAATDTFRDSLVELDKRLKDVTKSGADDESQMRDIAAIYDDVTQNAAKVADETQRVAEEQAAAEGTTLGATQKLDIWNQSMLDSASTADGPLRQAILNYVAEVNGIPAEKVSEIQALIDEGRLAEARTALDNASAARTSTVTADAQTAEAEAAIDEVARDRSATITVGANISSGILNLLDALGLRSEPVSGGRPRAATTATAGSPAPTFNLNLTIDGNIYGDLALTELINEAFAAFEVRISQQLAAGIR